MLKKIFTFLLLYFSLYISVLAGNTPVDEIFSDISVGYKYYDELQTLYDKGMILENAE
jgi:hypothetical protein